MNVTVPRFRKATDTDRSYTVYDTVVTILDHPAICLEKRYSQYHTMYRKINKSRHAKLELPKFPPKTLLNTKDHTLEERRLGLEVYIQAVTQLTPIPEPVLDFFEEAPEVVSFLLGDSSTSGQLSQDKEFHSSNPPPIMTFNQQLFQLPQRHPGATRDIVLDGVVAAFLDDIYHH